MKLRFVIDGLGTGGAERSLAEMLPRLVGAGIEPSVTCLYERREGVAKDIVRDGIDVRLLRGDNVLSRALELRRILSAERPDLVHTTLFDASLVGRLASARGGPPVLTSLVSTPYAPARLRDPNVRRISLEAVRLIDGWSARHLTSHFHAITNAVKRAAVTALGIDPERVTVIERGRDPGRLGEPSRERRRRTRSALGLRDDDEVIVHVGRQEFPKGHRYLVEAVDRIAPSRPRLIVLMVGRRGHASRELDRLAAHTSSGARIRWMGHRDDVPDLLAAADLFVFPSLFEGLGGALIEAMALGLPIVASDLDAVREVVDDGRNAVLVPPASSRAVADAIVMVLDDRRKAAAFGARSRMIFAERFTSDRSVARMIALYRDVLRQSRDPFVDVGAPA
jgi:glycosyltransferase involved in cell wall biosynthesis